MPVLNMTKLFWKFIKLSASIRDAQGKLGKKWYRSWTVWTNLVGILVVVLLNYFGVKLGPEDIAAVMGVINIILRLVSKDTVGFLDIKNNKQTKD